MDPEGILYTDKNLSGVDEGLWTTFHEAAWQGQHGVVQWLTLNGSLCTNDSSETFQKALIYPRTSNNTPDIFRSLQHLVKWAQKVTQSHSALVMFLLGTLPPALDMPRSRIIQDLAVIPEFESTLATSLGWKSQKESISAFFFGWWMCCPHMAVGISYHCGII